MVRVMLSGAAAAAASVCVLASPASAQTDGRFAIDFGIGTTGGTVEGKFALSDRIVLRGGYNYLGYELDGEEYDGVVYDSELDFSTFGGFVDLHPFSNGFMVTGGVYAGAKELTASATPSEPVDIGGTTFTPAEVGQLDFTGDLEDTAPFAGVGWDGAFVREGRFNIKLIAGVMFSGTPDLSLRSSGGALSDDPTFQAELAEEEASIQSEVEDYEYYPVISIGFGYRF